MYRRWIISYFLLISSHKVNVPIQAHTNGKQVHVFNASVSEGTSVRVGGCFGGGGYDTVFTSDLVQEINITTCGDKKRAHAGGKAERDSYHRSRTFNGQVRTF